MKVYLQSYHTELYKDFYDIIKIFIPNLELDLVDNGKQYDLVISFFEKIDGDLHLVKFETKFELKEYCSEDSCIIKTDSKLLYKKEYKRLVKNSLYSLLKKIFGKTSPWGSLTGVRPSYLFYESLESIKSLDKTCSFLEKTYDLDNSKAILLRDVVKTQLKLKPITDKSVDVYIGIPFCTSRCHYCTFASNKTDESNIKTYLNSLFKEIGAISNIIDCNNFSLRALYIGGGTPTALDDLSFESLLKTVDFYFSQYGEFEYSIEAGRPDTINEFKLNSMREHNVNRISINPQTLNDKTLSLIGRNHSSDDFFMAYELARKLGFNNINTDIIAALPKEQLEDFVYTVDEILKLNPESISVHTLALKRNSVLSNTGYSYKENDIAKDMIDYARNAVYSKGYNPYYLYRQKNIVSNLENVAYSKLGYECLYNVDIMEEKISILAAGAGAISKRVNSEKFEKIQRAPNVSDLKTYNEKIDEMINRKYLLFNMR